MNWAKHRSLSQWPLVVALLAAWLPFAAHAGAPDFPAPRKAEVQWVGKDILRNGIPMAIRMFRTEAGPEDVLAEVASMLEEQDRYRI